LHSDDTIVFFKPLRRFRNQFLYPARAIVVPAAATSGNVD
jgi:hypothetical protein